MKDITVTTIQSMLHWEDQQANFIMFERLMEKIGEKTDLIILPEMFTTGFSMSPEKLAEPVDGKTLAWMRTQAAKYNAVVTGSFIAEENARPPARAARPDEPFGRGTDGDDPVGQGKYYNLLLWVRPDGSLEKYAKRHLFRMAGEDKHYEAGKNKLIVELNGWKICPMICYDLRFPVWSRNRWTKNGRDVVADYDALIYVANWPEMRAQAWKTLLMARAMENQCYVIGVNRIGNDGHFIFHSGDTAIIDFKGAYMKYSVVNKEEVTSVKLSAQLLNEFRKSFPLGLDTDEFNIL
ncbi:MAG: nitrilase family protein [Bacteroidetes bacterium]|nr:nitrilase family protein [Bacteroidota bacterium]